MGKRILERSHVVKYTSFLWVNEDTNRHFDSLSSRGRRKVSTDLPVYASYKAAARGNINNQILEVDCSLEPSGIVSHTVIDTPDLVLGAC